MQRMTRNIAGLLCAVLVFSGALTAQSNPNLVVYEGVKGPGAGKHIVLISGDHEYRSEETLPALARILAQRYGFKCSLNPTFPGRTAKGWISKGYYGLDQGPVVLMIENQRSELIWRLMRGCPHIVRGLRRAGFDGGWLAARHRRPAS